MDNQKYYFMNITLKLRKEDAIILNKYGYDYEMNATEQAENVAAELRKLEEKDNER